MNFPTGGIDFSRPSQPTQIEQDTSAIVADMKARLGIVSNTLDVIFTQLGGNVWKYQANANKPLLPMYVNVHINTVSSEANLENKQLYYNNLLQRLPLALQAELLLDKQKLAEDRDPALLALDGFLEQSASQLAGLLTPTNIDGTASLSRMAINTLVMNMFLVNLCNTIKETTKTFKYVAEDSTLPADTKTEMTGLLVQMNAVVSIFLDKFEKLKELQDLLKKRDDISAEIREENQNKADQIKAELLLEMKNQLKGLNVLKDELKNGPAGSQLALFDIMVDCLGSLLGLYGAGDAQQLALASHIATQNIEQGKSETGFVGPEYKSSLSGVLNTVPEGAEREGLQSILTAVSMSLTSLHTT